MKKLSLSSVLLFGMLIAHAQTKTDSLSAKFNKNELKVNLLTTVLGYPSITYERILSKEFAIGLAVSVAIDRSIDWRSEFNPYVRYYIASKKAKGLFLEGNFMITNREDYSKRLYYEDTLPHGGVQSGPISTGIRNSYGVAGGVGIKLLTKKGLIGEINFGVGQFIGDFDEKRPKKTGLAGIDDMYFKGGISIGKRF